MKSICRTKKQVKRNTRSTWNVKDVVNAVILCVIMMSIELIIYIVTLFNSFASVTFSPGITALFCGPVYVLLIKRVNKPFATMTYCFMRGIIHIFIGNWMAAIYILLIGVIVEIILDKHRKNRSVVVGWVLISTLNTLTSMISVWALLRLFNPERLYIAFNPDFINSYTIVYRSAILMWIIVMFTLVMSIAGGLLGLRYCDKHFKKAGVI